MIISRTLQYMCTQARVKPSIYRTLAFLSEHDVQFLCRMGIHHNTYKVFGELKRTTSTKRLSEVALARTVSSIRQSISVVKYTDIMNKKVGVLKAWLDATTLFFIILKKKRVSSRLCGNLFSICFNVYMKVFLEMISNVRRQTVTFELILNVGMTSIKNQSLDMFVV